jgi:predicted membrane-bound mannosyltransferase
MKKLSHLWNIQPFLIIFFIALLLGIFKLDFELDKLPTFDLEGLRNRFSWRKLAEPLVYLGCFFFVTYIVFRIWFKPKDLYEFFHSYVFYLDLGSVKTGHAKPWTYFWGLLFRYEWLVSLTAIGGAIVAIVQRKKMDLFFLGWAVAILAAYSVISYKTPWIILNITVPLTFLGGCFIHFLMENIKKKDLKILVLMTFTLMATVTLFKSWALSHSIHNDIDNKYFYVHTQPSTHVLEKRLKTLLDANPDESLAIVSPEHWPFPFLLKDYDRVGYWGRIPDKLDSKIILAQDKQHDELPAYVVNTFHFEKYVLRGGVNLELYYSKELKP